VQALAFSGIFGPLINMPNRFGSLSVRRFCVGMAVVLLTRGQVVLSMREGIQVGI
jgi:hypothetical protein